MKVPPLNLTPELNRVGMGLPFGPDLLWRYPLPLQQCNAPPSSPLLDVKHQMPGQLAADPRLWSREDVISFLRWFEREFELPKIDSSKFCMNGKALCMLTKSDLAERAPGAGDVLHNTLQFLLRDAPQVPPSPITPHHPLLSPSPLTTPTSQPWSMVTPDIHTLGHLLQQGGSVTLSPAPSEQSGGSPRHSDPSASLNGGYQLSSSSSSTGSGHSGSHSDSEDSLRDSSSEENQSQTFSAQALASLKHLQDYQRAAVAALAAHTQEEIPQQQTQSPNLAFFHAQQVHHQQQQSQQTQAQKTAATQPPPPFSADEPVETGSNGRLLWDFLQQLLNDSQQRYSRYIAWKNRETGVFKIVDPPGLARLWGIQKNHLSMNYDKMSRALRYYYRVNILRKVQGERHCYQFLRNPSELKSIKNISLLRGTPAPPVRKWEVNAASTPMEEEEGPTDLSMPTVPSSPLFDQSPPADDPSRNINRLIIPETDVKTESFE